MITRTKSVKGLTEVSVICVIEDVSPPGFSFRCTLSTHDDSTVLTKTYIYKLVEQQTFAQHLF